MPICPKCTSEIPPGKRFCADCGTALDEVAETRTSAPDRPPSFTPSGPVSSDDGRFLPGAIVAERYRIVGLLGRGGMGEVYRADDLKLGQPVALKFLPQERARDAGRQERFLNEVRTALKVTHPNVCRVHDIGDVDGHPYLSMEYVDGEDLASLLRRIGRLPGDKAVEIARQLCAGLAAAHEQGILHRDLKPANVMLDGRGRVRITDFGLAGLEHGFSGGEVRAGTPGYMSPEQIAGKEVTVKSDLYALGLVMYEMFTGKGAFSGGSAIEVARAHTETTPTSPSSHIPDLDPAAESVILRCLEKDPAGRPGSPHAVAAALPGGDPLAAALAAGETPSPELVAAAGEGESMAPVVALGVALVSVLLVILSVTLAARDDLRAYVPMEKPPGVLKDRAQEVIRTLGYTEPVYSEPIDSAVGYSTWGNFLSYIEDHDESPDRWDRLRDPRPAVVDFWYRQSPDYFFPGPRWGSIGLPPVTRWNPFPNEPGEILVSLDMTGRLSFFVHTPKRYSDADPPAEPPDWSVLFELAGLEMDAFEQVESRYQRHIAPEHRAAWVGTLPEAPYFELRIEAQAIGGRPVLFGLLWPWEIEGIESDPARNTDSRLMDQIELAVMLAVLVVALMLARRNLKRDRADRRGALRLAIAMFALRAAWELLRAHAGLYGDPVLAIFVLGSALFQAAVVGAVYLALEPYARRVWPTMFTSWSRLVGGNVIRWKDPSVGRAVLAGIAGGALLVARWPVADFLKTTIAGRPLRPLIGNWNLLLGQRSVLAVIVDGFTSGATMTCFIAMVLVLALFVVRRRPAAVLATAGFFVLLHILDTSFDDPALAAVRIGTGILNIVIVLAVLVRFGFLSAIVSTLILNGIALVSLTHDWTAWFSAPAITGVVVLVALAAYGYWAATAGRRLFPEEESGA